MFRNTCGVLGSKGAIRRSRMKMPAKSTNPTRCSRYESADIFLSLEKSREAIYWYPIRNAMPFSLSLVYAWFGSPAGKTNPAGQEAD